VFKIIDYATMQFILFFSVLKLRMLFLITFKDPKGKNKGDLNYYFYDVVDHQREMNLVS